VRARLDAEGLVVALLGQPGTGHLGGSLYAREIHGLRGHGQPPAVDLVAERALHEAVRRLVRGDLLAVAHDLSDGGLLVALAELSLPPRPGQPGVGGGYVVTDSAPAQLFGEDHGRALVAFAPEAEAAVRAALEGVPMTVLGRSGGVAFCVADADGAPVVQLEVDALRAAWEAPLPTWLEA
jgi:phosphoribosylformylglycinamidine synthase